MGEKPRYSIRRNSVAMTRSQWIAVAVAMAVAVVGLVVAFTVRPAAGALVIGPAALTALLVIGFGRIPR